jgi:hypothetical protein
MGFAVMFLGFIRRHRFTTIKIHLPTSNLVKKTILKPIYTKKEPPTLIVRGSAMGALFCI